MDARTALEWRPRASLRYDAIMAEIRRHNILAAEELGRKIFQSLRLAMRNPMLYRASQRVEGIRELVVTANYLVPYRITETAVEVLDIVHPRRNWPNPPEPIH